MWWGFSPALDLCLEVNSNPATVLLIGQTDFRHVLKTLAKQYSHAETPNLKIFVFENSLANIARSMLFLTLALEKNLGLGKKSQLFLELYGNTLIRPQTRQYLCEASVRLARIVTNFNYAQNIMPFLSLDSLKYKDRDELEHIFKYWSGSEDFDILNLWEERLRAHLGTRYDSRTGVFDWDLHMRYRPYGAEILGAQEYKTFREKGISFLQDDTNQCVPNPTLASFMSGSKTLVPKYCGDIATGPYATFGFDCEDKTLLDKCNGHYKKSATDIFSFNIQQMLFEIEHKQLYNPPKEETQIGIRRDVCDKITQEKGSWRKNAFQDGYTAIEISGVEVIFLPITALTYFPNKAHFQGIFDLVTLPQYLATKLPGNWSAMCKAECKIVLESSKYVVGLSKDALNKSKVEVEDFMKNLGAHVLGDFDYKTHDFMRFMLKK